MVDGARRVRACVMAVLVGGWALVACGGSPEVVSVAIVGGDAVTDVGGRRALAATVVVRGGASTDVVWSVGDETVATVDPDGTVRGVADGDTTVTAASAFDPTQRATVALRVQPSGNGTTLATVQLALAEDNQALATAVGDDARIYLAGTTALVTTTNPSDLRDGFALAVTPPAAFHWDTLLATAGIDDARAIAPLGDGRTVVVGGTRGGLETPAANLGATDAFVQVLNAIGNPVWTRQFGSANADDAYGVAVAPSGDLVVVGSSNGDFDGTPSTGGQDVFVRWYRADGDLARSLEFGSATSATGGDSDTAYAVAVDGDGRVVLAGRTSGELAGANAGGFDGFVRVLAPDGAVRWSDQFGTALTDEAVAVAVGSDGRIAVAGWTRDALDGGHAGGSDAFVRVYEPDGALAWARQFGTAADDEASGVAIDAAGNVLVAGFTEGGLGASVGGRDAFLRKLDPFGAVRWTQQFGTTASDQANAVAVHRATGQVAVAGATAGTLGAASGGGLDAFVRLFGP